MAPQDVSRDGRVQMKEVLFPAVLSWLSLFRLPFPLKDNANLIRKSELSARQVAYTAFWSNHLSFFIHLATNSSIILFRSINIYTYSITGELVCWRPFSYLIQYLSLCNVLFKFNLGIRKNLLTINEFKLPHQPAEAGKSYPWRLLKTKQTGAVFSSAHIYWVYKKQGVKRTVPWVASL